MSVLAKPPPPSKGVRWADYHHSLLLFDVKEVEEGVKTAYGEADAVRADLNVVDGAGKGDAVPDTLVFPKVLAGNCAAVSVSRPMADWDKEMQSRHSPRLGFWTTPATPTPR
jgi:hypothetical protein